MTRLVAGLVSFAVLAVAASTAPAYALNQQTVKGKTAEAGAPISLTGVTVDAPVNSKQQSKIYQWSVKGRWGLKLGVNENEARPSGWNDVDAGAFYKISPSVRVGGSVGFGEKTKALQPRDPAQDKDQPRVRLETTFKF